MKNKKIISSAALAVLFWGATAAATTYTVTKEADTNDGTCDADCSLREAITAANLNPGNDIITLPAGNYVVQRISTCENNNVDGDLDVNIVDPVLAAQSLTINGAGAGTTFVDGGDLDRVFDVVFFVLPPPPPGLTLGGTKASVAQGLILNDLTVRNGNAHDAPSVLCGPTGDGGGIRNSGGGGLALNNVVVADNTANDDEGGGIANENGTVVIDKSTISGNHGDSNGGGIYSGNCPSLTVTNSEISGNSTTASGGGVFTDCSISTITNSTISTNTADLNGGGVADANSGKLRLRNVTVTNNTADFNSNNSGDGGGAFVQAITGAQLILRNTIIAGNSDLSEDTTVNPDCSVIVSGIITSEGFNLIGNGTGCGPNLVNGVNGDQVGTGGAGAINALLGPLANNGGPTKTHELLTGSTAIDQANPAGCFSNDNNDGSLLITDQRGFLRPVDGDHDGSTICDIGAFEVGLCGDGHVDPGEECDDGNTVSNDSCSATCQSEFCGDGIVQTSEGCDDVNNDLCSADCLIETCGDGEVDSGEQCDDGNTVNTDSCLNLCKSASCGDGFVEAGVEQCDDGTKNGTLGAACSSSCKFTSIALILGNGGCSLIR